MRHLNRLGFGALLALGVALGGCSLDLDSNPDFCENDTDCPAGERCERFAGRDDGLCLAAGIDAGPTDAGMDDGGSDAGMLDAGPDAGGCTDGAPCYSGPDGTAGQGVCAMGTVECVGGTAFCRNEVVPMASDDTCDGVDQDCDGSADEGAPVLANCTINAPGECARGEQRCFMGSYGCRPVAEASAEICNGLDDDCDSVVDEDAAIECYDGVEPDPRCTQNPDGTYTCVGVCRAGTSECVDGSLTGACDGAIVPAEETCSTDPALDEDCDGMVDEAPCNCADTTTQDCYLGPADAVGNGPCLPSTQTCAGSTWGECGGVVLPQPETCANNGSGDDDCNGVDNDVPGLGESCLDMGAMGVCRRGTFTCEANDLACSTPDAMANEVFCDSRDEDCDGTVDEDFVLESDDDNCGACGRTCGDNFTCCDSDCRNTATDSAFCGSCGVACELGMDCCGSGCTDLQEDPLNCGGCGQACGDSQVCCAGDCVDPLADPGNCNGCGIVCDQGSATACCGGTCADPSSATCTDCAQDCLTPTGTCCAPDCVDTTANVNHCMGCGLACEGDDNACCGAAGCTDTATDEAHCGACDNACTAATPDCCGSGCVDTQADPLHCGVCGNACDAGLLCCDGNCIDPDVTDEYCGACDNDCPVMQGCSNGMCCPNAQATFCPQAGASGLCVDTDSDPLHCGECGNPCGAEQTCCGGSCVNTADDEANCGGCGNPCSAPTATCCDSQCRNTQTDDSYCGPSCSSCGLLNCRSGTCGL